MITVIADQGIEDYIYMNHTCTRFADKKQFKEWLSSMDKERLKEWLLSDSNEIYFIDVSDKTWNEFKTKNSIRLELNTDEIDELIQKSSYIFLIKKHYVESCTYYPKDD